MSIFTVEIMRPGEFGLNTSATLGMPANWTELQDAKQKARITDDKATYAYELLNCKHDWLRPHIPQNADLLELNLLTARIERYVNEEMDVFEAMVKIETNRNDGKPIPFPRLINLAFSTDNCHVAENVTSDALLGRFLYRNDFLAEEDIKAVQARIDSKQPLSEIFAMLGKEHRVSEGGVFTTSGCYVEFDGSVNEIYTSGKKTYFDRSGAPVILKLTRDHESALLNLPEPHLYEMEAAKGKLV